MHAVPLSACAGQFPQLQNREAHAEGGHQLAPLQRGCYFRHGNHPVLTMCMANATVERDAAGNRKLSKKRSSGRIDGAVALAMAIAAAPAAWTAKVDIAALIG